MIGQEQTGKHVPGGTATMCKGPEVRECWAPSGWGMGQGVLEGEEEGEANYRQSGLNAVLGLWLVLSLKGKAGMS